jgi:tRNA threonylcarbamoyladenosine biosynthesis protein TsaE
LKPIYQKKYEGIFAVNPQRILLWERKFYFSELTGVAQEIIAELEKKVPFCLWLQGNLGAGKTALTREILYSMGLSREEYVTSPTFTLLNDYEIKSNWYAHLDLYRLSTLEDFDLSYRDFRGYFLEWPKETGKAGALTATHLVELEAIAEDSLERNIRFFSC